MTEHDQQDDLEPTDAEGASEGEAPAESADPGAAETGLTPPAYPASRTSASEGSASDQEGEEAGRAWSPSQMELAHALTQEPIAPKVYYSIGEVCDLTGLKPHVLRYWESQFEVMNPTKNRAGNRVYRPKDIDLVFLVRRLLYEEKYTIEGARKRLLEMRHEGALEDEKQEVLGPEFLAEMKRELLGLRALLTPSGDEAEA